MATICTRCGDAIHGAWGYLGGDAVCADCLPGEQEAARRNADLLRAEQARWERDNPLLRQLREAESGRE